MSKPKTKTDGRTRGRRITAAVSVCLVLLLLSWLSVVLYRRLVKIGRTPEDFKNFIDSFGFTGWLVALGIQFLQVVVALIPGEAVEIGVGYAFGAVEGTLICLLGVAIASTVVFLLTKRFGVRLLELFFPVDSIDSLRFINSEKRLNRTVFLLFFIPGTPKDLLTYFVGLTRMKLSTFLSLTLIARIPSVVSSVIGGDLIGSRNYVGAAVLFAVTGAVSVAGLQLYNLLLRRKKLAAVPKTARRVIERFLNICAIPHDSGHTLALSDYCLRFAKKHGLSADMDKSGNVWIEKPATHGYEQAPPVILQAHLDMVCEKAPSATIDFRKQAVTPVFDQAYLRADGTTLGADNGIGLAMILTVLADKTLPHPPLQAVLTVDEETGMKGALSLDTTRFHGRYLLNLDSEEEGVLTVGCAGGMRMDCRFPVTVSPVEGQAVTLSLSGLVGGHSGTDIHRGRANANRLLAAVLRELSDAYPLCLHALSGGTVDNAIPAAAHVTVLLPDTDLSAFMARITAMAARLREEWKTAEPTLSLTAAAEHRGVFPAVDAAQTRQLIDALLSLPNGVWEQNADFPDKPETSLNLGVLSLQDGAVCAAFSLRSFRDAKLAALSRQLRQMVEEHGGDTAISGGYPGWEYRSDSPLLQRAVAVYEAQYGVSPQLDAVHAGLECGVFCGKLPALQCLSFGPDITGAHTPEERVSLASVDRVYRFLCALLADRPDGGR